MVHVLVECYNVLYTYLMGDSRKNELYIAKYIDFFNSQISFQVRLRSCMSGNLGYIDWNLEIVSKNAKRFDFKQTRIYIPRLVAQKASLKMHTTGSKIS